MAVKQISVFVENRAGSLVSLTDLLTARGINLYALSIADTSDYGILRIIVDDLDTACRVLAEANQIYSVNEVLAVSMSDELGSLTQVLGILAAASINLEYLYAFISRRAGKAVVICRVADNAAAECALLAAGVELLGEDQLHSL